MEYQEITSQIINAAFTVHKALGAGFLEAVYHKSMFIELNDMGLSVFAQYPVPVFYKKHQVGNYYADLLVDDKIIVELKALERLHPAHEVQLVNYLAGTKFDIGLLINFGRSVEVKRKYRVYRKSGEN